MNRFWCVLHLLMICMFFPAKARAGGWTQLKGKSYLQASYLQFSTDREFFFLTGRDVALNTGFNTQQRGQLLDSRFSANSLLLYGEYGIDDGLTLIVSTSVQNFSQSFRDVRVSEEGATMDTVATTLRASGLGDTRISARFQLLRGALGAVALQTGVKLPTGSASAAIPFGTGEPDVELGLQGGIGFPFLSGYGYATADFGYRYRNGDAFNDEAFYSVQVGAPIVGGVSLKAGWIGVVSLGEIQLPASGVSQITNYTLQRFNAGLTYDVSQSVGCSGEVFQDVSGRNTAKGSTFTVSLYFKL